MKENQNKCRCVDYDIDSHSQYTYINLDNFGQLKQCKNDAIEGSLFCNKHQNCPDFVKRLVNGFEHLEDKNKWKNPYIEGSHNCYAYFLNMSSRAIKDRCKELCNKHYNNCPKKISQCGKLKPQPGDYNEYVSGVSKGNNNYSCPLMEKRILADNPGITRVKFQDKCPKYTYKGAMVVDPGHTYHFYRQNTDGKWTHKPGTLPVTDKDASGKVIYVPHASDRNYNKDNKKDGINYVDFCGYYCVPNNKYLNTHAI